MKTASITEGSLFRPIVMYTFPIMLTSIIQLLFNAADLVIVGRFCGSIYVAAVGATTSIISLITNFFIGLSTGGSVATAHAYGANDARALHRTVHTTVLISFFAGVFLTVVGVLYSEDFLRMMDTPENILPLSSKYMKIYFCGIIFSMLYNFASSILRAVGDTKRPLIYLSISGVVNVMLNIVFVTLFDMDIDGVALATVISQGLSAVLVLLALTNRNDACRLFIRQLRLYKEPLKKIAGIGIPAGIQSSLFSISNVLIQSSVNSFGDVFVTGNSAAMNIEGFVYVILNSFFQTSVTFTGQNYGAKNFPRIKKVFWSCFFGVTVVGLVAGAYVYLLGEQLLSIYITDSKEAIAYGLVRMKYICLPYFLCGIMDVTTGSIRGMGVSLVTMLISVFGVVGIRIGWIYTIFQTIHTPECLFFSYTVSWTITFLCQLIAFYIVYNKKLKEVEK